MAHRLIRLATLLGIGLTGPAMMISPAMAARPIIGITCGGGFFVTHRQDVYWINETDKTRTEVHDGSGELLAMAECGSGVVAILAGEDAADPLRVLYSPDCRNLSQAVGETSEIYRAVDRLKGFSVDETGVSVTLSSGARFTSDVCTRPASPDAH